MEKGLVFHFPNAFFTESSSSSRREAPTTEPEGPALPPLEAFAIPDRKVPKGVPHAMNIGRPNAYGREVAMQVV